MPERMAADETCHGFLVVGDSERRMPWLRFTNVASVERSGGTWRVFQIETGEGGHEMPVRRRLDIYVSPMGRSVRVFDRGVEMLRPLGD